MLGPQAPPLDYMTNSHPFGKTLPVALNEGIERRYIWENERGSFNLKPNE